MSVLMERPAYEPYTEPRWVDPQVTRRAYDGLWLVWVFVPAPEGHFEAEADSPQYYTKAWQIGRVLGSKQAAQRWAARWTERRKR